MKRVYRVMKAHGLLLERHTGKGEERRHDGRVAVDHPDTRWCSDGLVEEIVAKLRHIVLRPFTKFG